MTQYNLVSNGNLSSTLTTSGISFTATTTITASGLALLKDNNLTSSGITCSGSNTYLFNVDLSERIKIEDIRLYTTATGVTADTLAKVNFYYSNTASGSYSSLTTYSGSSYYYATLPSPSAPWRVSVTVSGITDTFYELTLHNDDYLVAFGDDGTQTAGYLEDTPIGEIGDTQAIQIYNNAPTGFPVNAYVCVDYTGSSADYYIDLATTATGTWYNLTDGAIISGTNSSATYTWDMCKKQGIVSYGNGLTIGASSQTIVDQGYLVQTPMSNQSYVWAAGPTCWDFDPTSGNVYVVGSDSIIKLWSYSITTNVFTYLGELASGTSGHASFVVATYCNGGVYCLPNGDQSFGYYNLSTSTWSSLTSHPVAKYSSSYTALSKRMMCSDRTRYIYTIDTNTGASKNFYRYDTVSGTWASLSNSYSLTTNTQARRTRGSMSYDTERSVIYVDVGGDGGDFYIQRYDIASNTWNTSFLNMTSIGCRSIVTMSYYDNLMWIFSNDTLYSHFLYNVATGTTTGVSYTTNPYGSYCDDFNGTSTHYNYPMLALAINGYDYLLLTGVVSMVNGYTYDGAGYGYKFIHYIKTVNRKSSSYGSMTTPVLKLAEPNNSSYITINSTGQVSVTSSDIDSIEVRSSSTKPLSLVKLYIPFNIADGSQYINYRCIYWEPYKSNSLYFQKLKVVDTSYVATMNYMPMAISHINGNYNFVFYRSANADWNWFYNHNSNHSSVFGGYQYFAGYYDSYSGADYDGAGNIWRYKSTYSTSHVSSTAYAFIIRIANGSTYYTYTGTTTSDTIAALAPDEQSSGAWTIRTFSSIKALVRLDYTCSVVYTITALTNPTLLASDTSSGCWVYDATTLLTYRYNSSGNLVTSYSLGILTGMKTDYAGGIWVTTGTNVYHVTSGGIIDYGPITIANNYIVKGSSDHCMIYSIDTQYYYLYSTLTSSIIYSVPASGYTAYTSCAAFMYTYEREVQNKTNLLPLDYDPVWGISGTATWKTVPKNGFFLPKNRYHQFRLTLRNGAVLNNIIMAPTVKLSDIPAGQSKSLYVRTNVPSGATLGSANTKLKCWWGVTE